MAQKVAIVIQESSASKCAVFNSQIGNTGNCFLLREERI
jgi:hypothetical protein